MDFFFQVKVMLRIKGDSEELNSSFLNIDARKKQITVYDLSASDQSSPAERRTGVSAPKMFAFDAIFSPDDAQAEVCSSSLPDVIQAVVGGTDGCLFVYGQSKLVTSSLCDQFSQLSSSLHCLNTFSLSRLMRVKNKNPDLSPISGCQSRSDVDR
ncbi:Kinesin-like protein KIF26B [Araneus ventricosus]|uniref:Kinesin-like protein KIF26B n=1 Tax=Araneus ventricosus TaxID=182803 RepID=A0A4Y2QRH4_ARAVE|nr:Kinesin-like protein KIF26B [Araneus ventricosus]GBN65856.1 Kinesin-like protein KIF26B [Araneus ventricosus]